MDLRTGRERLSLDGEWEFRYDPDECGVREQWAQQGDFTERIAVPGCAQQRAYASARMAESDYAALRRKKGPDMRWPGIAPAWIRRRVMIPREWTGREIWLHLGGVMPAADLWLNGVALGSTRSSRTPLRCDLAPAVRPGAENLLTLRLAQPVEGPGLEGVFDFRQAIAGLYRSAWLEAAAPAHIRELFVRTVAIDPPAVVVEVLCARPPDPAARLALEVRDAAGAVRWAMDQAAAPEADGVLRAGLVLPGASLWSPDSPTLYTARVRLDGDASGADWAEVRFGVRELRRDGDRILLNGMPMYLRGGCDDQVYPETICPPADTAYYRARLQAAKAYGFNYTKSAHEVFTEEFLEAADEVGYLVCQEMPFGIQKRRWTAAKSRRELDPAEADFLRREFDGIIRSRRTHPCLAIGAVVGEVIFEGMTASVHRFLGWELPARWRALHPGVLLMDFTHINLKAPEGAPPEDAPESADEAWRLDLAPGRRLTDIIEQCPGYSPTQEPLSHPLPPLERLERPGLYHEYDWIASLPELGVKSRYDGLPTFSSGMAEMEASAARYGTAEHLPLWVERSRQLKRLLQKEALELARRNPHITGYHFWLIHGFSGCEEGVFNEFWDVPEDLSAETFRRWNADTVVLLDDGNRRVFAAGTEAALGVQVSHFGPTLLEAPSVTWRLTTGGRDVAGGRLVLRPVPQGTLTEPVPLPVRFPPGAQPARYELSVELAEGGTAVNRNSWSLWTVPLKPAGAWTKRVATDLPWLAQAWAGLRTWVPGTPVPAPVLAVNRVTPGLLDWLEGGGRLVLFGGALKDFRYYFPGQDRRGTAEYNADPWGHGRLYRTSYCAVPGGHMGTVMAEHPVLGGFPHAGWCETPFVPLIHGTYPLVLEWFKPTRIEPIIRSIGSQTEMFHKAYLFEAAVGRGALLATSLRFEATALWTRNPQMPFLLAALLDYAAGDSFQPRTAVPRSALEAAVAPGLPTEPRQ